MVFLFDYAELLESLVLACQISLVISCFCSLRKVWPAVDLHSVSKLFIRSYWVYTLSLDGIGELALFFLWIFHLNIQILESFSLCPEKRFDFPSLLFLFYYLILCLKSFCKFPKSQKSRITVIVFVIHLPNIVHFNKPLIVGKPSIMFFESNFIFSLSFFQH